MVTDRKTLGQLLIKAGMLNNQQLNEALEYKKEHKIYLGKALVLLKMISEEAVIQMVSEQLRIPSIDPLTYKI